MVALCRKLGKINTMIASNFKIKKQHPGNSYFSAYKLRHGSTKKEGDCLDSCNRLKEVAK